MTIHVTPIPSTIELTTPAFTLGTANSAGAALTSVASNSSLAMFSTALPEDLAYSDSSSTGTNALTSREDHVHGMPAGFTASLVMAYGQLGYGG